MDAQKLTHNIFRAIRDSSPTEAAEWRLLLLPSKDRLSAFFGNVDIGFELLEYASFVAGGAQGAALESQVHGLLHILGQVNSLPLTRAEYAQTKSALATLSKLPAK